MVVAKSKPRERSRHDAAVWTMVNRWTTLVGLDPATDGTHRLRRTKVSLISKRTGNLRACQLVLGHTKLESTVRYLGIKVDDAPQMLEQEEI